MLKWVEPMIWWIMQRLSDLCQFTGLVTLLGFIAYGLYRGIINTIEKEDYNHED